ncbi:terminase large subunit [Azospirillum sp.]|uniref:terminase large subunit n=1 Tax=Azospirillum sp. TaxID=34012 RepID=UPI002D3F323F|nr:terminase large subunit [Azospirillum sp.]HYF88985.1 terminase large subunit [Azospirillum sp.]
MEWSTACPDWERRILAGESLIPFAPLFPAEAEAALDVFRDLRIVDAPGSPAIADCCRPWVMDYASALFGAYDHSTGRRLIRETLLLVSKKNSKSTIAAGIMLTALIRNWRMSGEFIILAPTVEIAKNSFGPAADMVRASEELSELLHVQDHIRTITHKTTGATLKVVAADSDTVGGKKAIIVLVDELWLFGKRPNAENMFREAMGGLASRPEGLVIYLTTQSDEPPAGVFRQKLNYARDVRDGKVIDPQFLPVLYEFPGSMVEGKAYLQRANFYITNPNIGASVDEEFLEREFGKAENSGEESLRGFLAKHLNVEIGLNLRSDRWAGADYWEGAAEPGLTLDRLLERSEVVTVGIDGGGADDLLGLAVIGREKETRRWLHWAHAWAHPKALERRKENVTTYEGFKASGDMTVIRDYPEDLDGVVEVVARINEAGLLACVGVDTIGLAGIVDALAEIGVTEDSKQVAGIGQGYVLTGAIKGLERKLIDGSFVHGGQPLMNWCVGNARVEPTKNAFLVTKQASGYAKIDPLMATFDAAKLMERNPEAKGPSVYEARGILFV